MSLILKNLIDEAVEYQKHVQCDKVRAVMEKINEFLELNPGLDSEEVIGWDCIKLRSLRDSVKVYAEWDKKKLNAA